MRRGLRCLVKFLFVCCGLLFLLIAIEVARGWHCNLQGQIPDPTAQPESRKAAVSDIKDYSRPEDDAYLSLPEWHIVWSYQEKADFQRNNLPSGFPYFGAVRQYWTSYCCVSRLMKGKYGSNLGEQVMLVVIGTSFSAEYILKGLYEKTIGRFSEWTSNHQLTDEDRYAYRVAREYADFVHVRPFYEFRFARQLRGLWAENSLWGAHPARKWERRAFLTIDYAVEAFYCWLIEKGTHLTYGYEPSDTYAWVETVGDAVFPQLAGAKLVKNVGPQDYILELPRYQEFTPVASIISQRGVRFVEIAGNSQITVSVLAPKTWRDDGFGIQALFTMPVLTRPDVYRVVLRSDVTALSQALIALPSSGAVVEHVYDY